MGYMKDHAIVVSHWNEDEITEIRNKAVEIFKEDSVSPIMGPYVNGHVSFFIPPDGSKEGWRESKDGDDRRAAFKDFINSSDLFCHWVELFFGEDNDRSEIVEHN